MSGRGLTEQQERFCNAYVVNGGNGSAAAVAAGYSHKSRAAASRQVLKLVHVQSRIKELTLESMVHMTPKLLKHMAKLATHGKSEQVRFAAMKDLLDRTGTRLHEDVATQGKDVSLDDLIQRAQTLAKELSVGDDDDDVHDSVH
jgi:phage terminase small subunit